MQKEAGLCVRDLIVSGRQDPDAVAIESPGYLPLTYRALREQITYIVRSLNARGFRPNDRIAVIMPNGAETAVAILGVMAGFTVITLNARYKAPEFHAYFSDLGIKAILVQKGDSTAAVAVAGECNIPVIQVRGASSATGVFSLVPDVECQGTEPIFATPQDIAAILLTTGTTAKPKAVPIRQKRFFAGMGMLNQHSGLTGTDRNLHFLPLDTGFGYASPIGGTLVVGGSLICVPEFIPSEIPNLLRTYRPTYYWGGPAHHQAIVQELKKLPRRQLAGNSLRMVCTASAVISPGTYQDLKELLGIPVIDAYVMSEAFISMNNPPKQGSVGIPFISELEIRNDDDQKLPAGQIGEIVVRGDLVFEGYLDTPEESAGDFRDGWFRTGDVGYLDDEGYLFLAGRKKELINKGGRKIAPAEIDAMLLSHPGVMDAMTFRIPDAALGEDLAAIVVRKDSSLSEEDLHRYCLDRLIRFKVPRRIIFVDQIPRNALGKPLREEGTMKFAPVLETTAGLKAADGPRDAAGPTPMEENLLRLWRDILDLPEVSVGDDFFQSGGNSLSAIELLIRIQREYHISLPPDTIYRYPTIKEQVALLIAKARTSKEYHPLIFPLRETGHPPPLFCIHPLGGWMDHYLKILSSIDPDRPVFGIRGRGLIAGEVLPTTVEDTAREQVDAIRSVQKTGPYHLLGFSNGGILAYELACQLQEQGEEVSFLGLIDVSAPSTEVRYFKTLVTTLFPGKVLGKIPAFFEDRLKAHHDSRIYRYTMHSVRSVTRRMVARSGGKSLPQSVYHRHSSVHFNEKTLEHFPKESRPNMRVQLNASRMYLPQTFRGDIVLFSTAPDPLLHPGDRTRGWGSLITGTCEVIPVTGDHSNLFDAPHITVLQEKIREKLGKQR